MTTIDTTRPARTPMGLGIRRAIESFKAWNDTRITRNALSLLTDRELTDIGLTRSEVAEFTVR